MVNIRQLCFFLSNSLAVCHALRRQALRNPTDGGYGLPVGPVLLPADTYGRPPTASEQILSEPQWKIQTPPTGTPALNSPVLSDAAGSLQPTLTQKNSLETQAVKFYRDQNGLQNPVEAHRTNQIAGSRTSNPAAVTLANPDVTLALPPMPSSIDIQNYPLKPTRLPIPNAMNAAKALLQNSQDSLSSAPAKLVGGTEDMANTANQVARGAAVAGNYGTLNALLGLKPNENTGSGEYRRLTQVPSIEYTLSKRDSGSLTDAVPQMLLRDGLQAQRAKIQELDDDLQTAVRQEKELHNTMKPVALKNAHLLQALKDVRATGPIGLGNMLTQQAHLIKERAAIALPKQIRTHFYTPAKDRSKRSYVLQEPFQWNPHVRRTYKTALPAEDSKILDRVVHKKSFSEKLDQAKLWGPAQQAILEQLSPTRMERLDTD